MNPQKAKRPPPHAFQRSDFKPCSREGLEAVEGLAEPVPVDTSLAMESVQRRGAFDPTSPPRHHATILPQERSPLRAGRFVD